MKDEKIQIRITKADKQELTTISEKLDIPASQIAREAIREKISELTKSLEPNQEVALESWGNNARQQPEFIQNREGCF